MEEFFELDRLSLVSCQPSLVFDLNDLTETLVLREFTVDTFEVALVILEDFDEAVHAQLVPPATHLTKGEAAAQNVTHIAATTDVGGEGSIRDGNKDRTRVIKNDEHLFDDLNRRLKVLNRNLNLGGKFSPAGIDVVDLVNVESAGVGPKLHPDVLVNLNTSPGLEELHCVLERVGVTCSATVVQPSDTLKTDSTIDNFHVKLLTRAIVEGLVLHEDQVADLKTVHEVLNRRAKVATTGPHVLDKSDLIWVDSHRLCQPAIVELDCLILEEVVFVRCVEHLDSEHDKTGVMATSDTNVVQVIEARAELRADQGVSGRVELTSHAVGLEAEDASGDVVNVVSPASDNGVAIDGVARDASRGKTLLEA